MSRVRSTWGIVLSLGALHLCFAPAGLAAYSAVAPKDVNLSGNWKLNPAHSDDAEALLQERLDEIRKQREKWMRNIPRADPLGIPPLGMPPLPPESEADAPPAQDRPPPQKRSRRTDELRRMLGISDTLTITQSGTKIDIVSAVDARRFDAGTQSQVSMPQGELADSNVGWDGQWFIIERKASRGPRVLEKYRWLRKTDQLESLLVWSGDTPLSGIKIHRIYDRMQTTPPAPDPGSGPIR